MHASNEAGLLTAASLPINAAGAAVLPQGLQCPTPQSHASPAASSTVQAKGQRGEVVLLGERDLWFAQQVRCLGPSYCAQLAGQSMACACSLLLLAVQDPGHSLLACRLACPAACCCCCCPRPRPLPG